MALAILGICLAMASCKVPAILPATANRTVPTAYADNQDKTNTAIIPWRTFLTDQNLVRLIDTALVRNQELNITLQEINIAQNEARLRQAPLAPTVGLRAGGGVEKVGRYTSQGAGDESTEIKPGVRVPDALQDYVIGAYANWEVDIWKKLRNARKAAITRYLSSVEGRNFALTNLVAEVANSYYELLSYDNQLLIVRQNIELQKNALEIIKVQKEAARATELAVQKFQAEVLKTQSLEFGILQQIREKENHINFLLGRYPQPILRDTTNMVNMVTTIAAAGIPSQLLANRPDIKQAELELTAARLDVQVARAEFFPTLGISAVLGFQAFKPSYLIKLPQSLLYSLAGDIAAPLVNRVAIKAEFASASARQLQALYNYERIILNAYMEVSTQLSNITNLSRSYELKSKQVDALTLSIDISNDLFNPHCSYSNRN